MTSNVKRARTVLSRLLVGAVILLSPTAALAQQTFDRDSYAKTTLDKILENSPKTEQDSGLQVIWEKLQFPVRLKGYPKPCKAGLVAFVLAMRGVDVSVTHCIKVSSRSGKTQNLFVQDALVEAFKAETKPGEVITVYVLYLFYNEYSKSRGFLVGEFAKR